MESSHAGYSLPIVVAILFVPAVLVFLLICVACSRSKTRKGKAVVDDGEKVNGGDCSKVQLKNYRLLPEIQITRVPSSAATQTRSSDVSLRTVHKVDQLGLGGLPADSLTYELEQVQRSLAESDHVTAECANVSEVFLSPRLECDLALAIANDQTCRNSVFLSQLARSPTTKRESLLSTSVPILSPLAVPADIKIVAKERTLL
ncbi:hypothetical protein TTRE_0000284801 [Trichuris trichiura]|uniref:Uncharacterized protein n=1 Tax=Trichuris trichiura TaxID=36087 RepID=A0A077Z4J0_TRITR|nr:hypothetical protein TTRE_0000284801 [Trichuris trichiura]